MEGSQDPFVPETPLELSQRISLPFNNISLLTRALTHRSYMNENSDALEDNERLEFLGDAILDFVVGAWLYNHFPEMNEGEMTRMRAALVRTEQLAEFGIYLKLGNALRLGRGEDEGGGRSRLAMLCATFEAVVGALYIDSKILAVEIFMARFLGDAAERIMDGRKDRDAKSSLQEWSQANGYSTPHYLITKEDGPDHEKTFHIEVSLGDKVYGTGEGRSKQAASKMAAQEALDNLNVKR